MGFLQVYEACKSSSQSQKGFPKHPTLLALISARSEIGERLIPGLGIKPINNAHKYGFLESHLASPTFWVQMGSRTCMIQCTGTCKWLGLGLQSGVLRKTVTPCVCAILLFYFVYFLKNIILLLFIYLFYFFTICIYFFLSFYLFSTFF